MSDHNGPKIDGFICTKTPKGCVRGQCTMCDFYKPVNSSPGVLEALALVLVLMVVVPGFMLLCWCFPLFVLLVGLVGILTIFILFAPPADTKPCPCCGQRLPTNGRSTCYECRSTQVNRRA